MGLRKKTESKKNSDMILKNSLESSDYHSPAHYYHEGEVELDAIERLKSNIFMLDDLQQRLAFMNKELESILGSKLKS